MKKNNLILAAVITIALAATACSGKTGTVQTAPAASEELQITTAAGQTEAADQTAEGAQKGDDTSKEADDSSASEGTVTGVVEENKGFMITITDENDSEAYVFALDDAQSQTYQDIKAGDKVAVSYTNGLPTPDNLDTVVTDIRIVK